MARKAPVTTVSYQLDRQVEWNGARVSEGKTA